MVRSQCRVSASFGGGVAVSLATVRLSPQGGKAPALHEHLVEALQSYAPRPGLTGAHLLITDTPQTGTLTTEQRIRGSDSSADWIVLLSGYDPDVLNETVSKHLSASALHRAGAQEGCKAGFYTLAFAMAAPDVRTAPPRRGP